MTKQYLDSYLTGFIPKARPHFEINGCDKCPRCGTGIIIEDFHDAVCLNCGLRETNTVDIITYYEEEIIQWLIRNSPRELFATFAFLSQNIIGDNTKVLKIPADKGIINPRVASLLLKLADLEQRGVIKIHSHGVIRDYESVVVIYDVLDEAIIDKRLVPVGVL